MNKRYLTSILVLAVATSASAGRKIANVDYTPVNEMALYEMSAGDLETLLKKKKAELAEANEILTKGEKVEIPDGVLYRIPDGAVVVGAIGGTASLIGAVLNHRASPALEAALAKADDQLSVQKRGKHAKRPGKMDYQRGELAGRAGIAYKEFERARKALLQYESEVRKNPEILATSPAQVRENVEMARKNVEAKRKAYEVLHSELLKIMPDYNEKRADVRAKTAIVKKHKANFKNLAGLTAGMAGVAIGGLAAKAALKNEYTFEVTEEEKAQLETTVSLLMQEVLLVEGAIAEKSAE